MGVKEGRYPPSVRISEKGVAWRQSDIDRLIASLSMKAIPGATEAPQNLQVDNAQLRALCTLPPLQALTSTEIAMPELPPQAAVTGDTEIDAVLWLREVIKTGQPDLIDKAVAAAKLIKTPLADLEKRYTALLLDANPGNWVAAFSTVGFADLPGLIATSTAKYAHRHEALSRFGSVCHLWEATPAEQFAEHVLKGVKHGDMFGFLDDAKVDARFEARQDLMPHTLDDCIVELDYWHGLYVLRNAVGTGDPSEQAYARETFAFRNLARIRPRSRKEASRAFQYLVAHECMDRDETDAILRNLISGQPSVGEPQRQQATTTRSTESTS